jgi:hypothetical protein
VEPILNKIFDSPLSFSRNQNMLCFFSGPYQSHWFCFMMWTCHKHQIRHGQVAFSFRMWHFQTSSSVNGILNNSNRLLTLLLFCMEIKYQFLHTRWNRKQKHVINFLPLFLSWQLHHFLLFFVVLGLLSVMGLVGR